MLVMVFGACENNRKTDCSNCVSNPTDNAKLGIYISLIGDSAPGYDVKIYEGPMEDNNLLDEIIMRYDYTEYKAMVNKDYTFTVEYTIDGVKYIAVDSVRPKAKYDETTCDLPCYYIYDNIVDLRLKYSK